jgi:protocatechuate 3,4-dioxygenase beta subunit
MRYLATLAVLSAGGLACTGQSNPALTEGYDFARSLNSTDTSPGWNQNGQRVLLTGIVYLRDAVTPAADALVYYYHTDVNGRYVHRPEVSGSMPPNELGQTHGYIRGWVKTDREGRYSIYTVRPGVYPTRDSPAHIHATVREPDTGTEYYIDDFVFDDDKLLTSAVRRKFEYRGGSGVLRLVQDGELNVGERNIILGLNIPDYPAGSPPGETSGPEVGEDLLSFTPYHAWGPDKGTRTCPVCKYGWYHGILLFVGDQPAWFDIRKWLNFLEQESLLRDKYLKAYLIYGSERDYEPAGRTALLAGLGKELNLTRVALTFVPSFRDSESDVYLARINPGVRNTIILYKRSRVIAKYVNLEATSDNFTEIKRAIDQSITRYYDLPR